MLGCSTAYISCSPNEIEAENRGQRCEFRCPAMADHQLCLHRPEELIGLIELTDRTSRSGSEGLTDANSIIQSVHWTSGVDI